MATDLHGGLVQRQPPPRRFHIYRLSPRIFAAHAGTRTNHGTFQPCAGTSVASVHLYKAGASQYINYFVLPLSYSAQERPLPQAYAPCGCEARGHAYGGDGRIRTSVRRVCSRVTVTHTRLFLPGVAERNYRLCHISMRGGAGLSRLSPLRVGCLRLAPIGTRFCFLLVLYPRKPVQLVLRMSTGSGADGRIRTCDFPSSRFTLRSGPLPRLRYVCIEGGARLSEPPANHVMAHRRFYVSRVLSVPEHTCSKENLMASLLGTSPCVRNYNIEA